MGEFFRFVVVYFRGRRRKIGAATLVMACVFMIGWIRSQNCLDVIEPYLPRFFGARIRVVSGSGRFTILSQNHPVRSNTGNRPAVFYRGSFFRWVAWNGEGLNIGAKFTLIPYWSIVIPLTLLSAWLLISNPRKRKAVTTETG